MTRFLSVIVLTSALWVSIGVPAPSAGQTSVQLHKEAVDRAKSVIVRSLDGTLPDRSLEIWLRDLFGTGAKTTWEVNDCGEQTGEPQRDRGRDFPMCVDVTVSLTDNRALHVLLAVGTFKTGVRPATPAFSYGVVLQAGVPIRWLKALGEATAISRSADRTGARR